MVGHLLIAAAALLRWLATSPLRSPERIRRFI